MTAEIIIKNKDDSRSIRVNRIRQIDPSSIVAKDPLGIETILHPGESASIWIYPERKVEITEIEIN